MGENNRLPLFNMAKRFIWINETKQRINELTIGCIINPGLNVNKAFREQGKKFMNTTFGEITQPFIKATLAKNNTSVLALVMFYKTRAEKKYFRVFSCVICTIIKNYFCIDYLACQSKTLTLFYVRNPFFGDGAINGTYPNFTPSFAAA